MAESGSVVWPSQSEPLWRFDWSLADIPDVEGIVISQANYLGHQVFYKGSLPSLRVQYDGNACGPYKDELTYNNARTTSRCPTRRVCVYSFVSAGYRGLIVESYHLIGLYRLTHRWVFWDDGTIWPRLYSAGLQCNYDHRHHAYWRFDFDIDDASNDVVQEYNTNAWTTRTTETSRVQNVASQRSWAVMDRSSGRGYYINPGPNDGQADLFSNRDLWVLRYHVEEDRHGLQGSASSDGLQSYLNGEDVNGQDLVVWYVGHLAHEAHAGGDEWHYVGPDLIPFRWQ